MALGRRPEQRQEEFWIATQDVARTPRHLFCESLNRLLAADDFDEWLEDLCREHYAESGRPSIPPGVFFRMLLVGYFEGLDSQRQIAWRCEDSLSLRAFLSYSLTEEPPDHSSLTRIRQRLPREVFDEVFRFVLAIVHDHKLLDAKTVGVDATTLEANAAMKSIVRRDSGEDWDEYLKRLAAEDGVEINTKADLIRYDKDRHDKGQKKVSNDEWTSPADPDARITKMKDGTTHLAYKAEQVVELKHGVILAAEIYHGDAADTATLTKSLVKAQTHLEEAEICQDIEKAAADKGYHKAETLAACEELGCFGVKTYIPEPESRYERRWTDKPASHQQAVCNNRRRTGREYGKRLQRRRSEVVERTFAHACDTGGARRSWLRGIVEVSKRYLLQAAAHNLGVVLRKLLGAGKPREFAAVCGLLLSLCRVLWRLTARGRTPRHRTILHRSILSPAIATPPACFLTQQYQPISTGC